MTLVKQLMVYTYKPLCSSYAGITMQARKTVEKNIELWEKIRYIAKG